MEKNNKNSFYFLFDYTQYNEIYLFFVFSGNG